MSEQRFPDALPQAVAGNYSPARLHDEAAPRLTTEQRQQARLAAEAVVKELKEVLSLT